MSDHRHDWRAVYRREGGYVRVGSWCACGQFDGRIMMPFDVGATVRSLSKAADCSIATVRRAVMKGELNAVATVDGEMVFADAEVTAWLTGR